MNYLFRFFISWFFIFLLPLALFSQVPNAGFEQWSAGNPVSWLTDNVPGVGTPVTQSGTSHSGSFAVRGEVTSLFGTPYPPTLYSAQNGLGFPVSQRYATFSGYYQFSPTGGDLLSIIVIMEKNKAGIGAGELFIGSAVSGYTSFNVGITYVTSDVPDTVIIQFAIVDTTAGLTNIGSYFLLDDLSLSGVAGLPQTAATTVPNEFSLSQNYPNPFNPSTSIRFTLAKSTNVSLIIYNTVGQEVARLADNKNMTAGEHTISWTAEDLPNGVYFYRLVAGNFDQIRKMILIK
jgi:hypothetical protein